MGLGPPSIDLFTNLLSANLTKDDEIWRFILAGISLILVVVVPSFFLFFHNKVFKPEFLETDVKIKGAALNAIQATFISMGIYGLIFALVILANLWIPISRKENPIIKGQSLIGQLVNLITNDKTTEYHVEEIARSLHGQLLSAHESDKLSDEKLNMYNTYVTKIQASTPVQEQEQEQEKPRQKKSEKKVKNKSEEEPEEDKSEEEPEDKSAW